MYSVDKLKLKPGIVLVCPEEAESSFGAGMVFQGETPHATIGRIAAVGGGVDDAVGDLVIYNRVLGLVQDFVDRDGTVHQFVFVHALDIRATLSTE